MAASNVIVQWFGNGGTLAAEEIVDFTSCIVRAGSGKTNNTFELRLKNVNERWVDPNTQEFLITNKDVIKVFARNIDTKTTADIDTSSADDLIMLGEVLSTNLVINERGAIWTIKGTSKTHTILNKLDAKAYIIRGSGDTRDKNAPEIIVDVLKRRCPEITADLVSNGGFVQDTREDSSDFPDQSISFNYKPIFDIVEELSGTEYTNSSSELQSNTSLPIDKRMIFYIDEENNFHWEYPDQDTIDYTFTDIDQRFRGCRLDKEIFDGVNMVIFSAGKDINNIGISWYYYDQSSELVDLQMTYRPFVNISKDLKLQEVQVGNLERDSTNGDLYNFLGTAGVSPSWDDSVVVNNSSDYNDEFRNRSKALGTAVSRAITQGTTSPRFRGSISVDGDKYLAAQLIDFTSTAAGIKNLIVRIKEIVHNIEPDSWTSELTVQEDDVAIGV